MKDLDDRTINVDRLEDIPKFADEAEEVAFWDSHSLAPELFTQRGPRRGGLAEKLSRERFKPHVVMSKAADAAYVYLRWGRPKNSKQLDERRIIDYADDGEILGVRFLDVSLGLKLDDIPEHEPIRKALKDHKPPIYA